MSSWEGKSSTAPQHASSEKRLAGGERRVAAEPWAAAYDRLGNRAFAQRLGDMVPRGGRPLPTAVREDLEPRLGADFGAVRVHDGADARAMAKSVAARAYTVGSDVVFGAGGFAPETHEGRRLLAHELAHVAQQGGARAGSQPLAVSRPGDASERAADAAADAVAADPFRPFRDAWRPTPIARAMAPARVAPALARAPLGSNAFGAWDIAETPFAYDSLKDGLYHYNVEITFAPKATAVDSTKIDFIQAAKVVDSGGANQIPQFTKRLSKDNWAIDQNPGAKSPWYQDPPGLYTPPGAKKAIPLVVTGSSPKPLQSAILRDWPGWNVASLSWSFETAAIAREGKDAGQVYGSVTWGFEVDAKRNLTAHKAALSTPGAAFKGATAAWDAQATGPKADRSAPDQFKVPALKYP